MVFHREILREFLPKILQKFFREFLRELIWEFHQYFLNRNPLKRMSWNAFLNFCTNLFMSFPWTFSCATSGIPSRVSLRISSRTVNSSRSSTNNSFKWTFEIFFWASWRISFIKFFLKLLTQLSLEIHQSMQTFFSRGQKIPKDFSLIL